MTHFSAWMGAGVLAAGVSAAMIAGADTASADTGTDDTTSGTSASAPDREDRKGPSRAEAGAGDTADTADRDKADNDESDDSDEDGADKDKDEADKPDVPDEDDGARKVGNRGGEVRAVERQDASPAAEEEPATEEPATEEPATEEPATEESDPEEPGPAEPATEEPATEESDPEEPATQESANPVEPLSETVDATDDDQISARAAKLSSSTATTTTTTAATAAATPTLPALPDVVQSFVFDVIGVAVTFIAGPPVVPPGSTVTVRTSSLEITDGRNVPAHWYYPEGDEPPEQVVYLQHGFLGVGAMYSYTAANLAQTTNSIVVVPTLTSNRFVRDGFWLGSDQALRATADLLVGDREALTASAIAAGFAQRYGAGVALPEKFALVGHSLGGNLVAGAAGYYADAVIAGGTDNQLAGVVLLDAAPQLNVLSDALDKLDGLDTYIPVLELGAPKESRRVDAALNEHRPGKFNGVVLENGKHLDAMEGGTWLIQFISHLYQGFPTAQNQAAAQTLVDGWVADILDGRIDSATGRCDGDECAGIYGDIGETFGIDTPVGPTSASVIGTPLPARSAEFQPWSVTAPVAPRPPVGGALLLRL